MSTNNSISAKFTKLSKKPSSNEEMKFNIIGFYKPSSRKYISVIQSPKKNSQITQKIKNNNKNKNNNTLTCAKSYINSSVNTTKSKKNFFNKTLNNNCSLINTLEMARLKKIIPEEKFKNNNSKCVFNVKNLKYFYCNYKKLVPFDKIYNSEKINNYNSNSSVKNTNSKNKKLNNTSCNSNKNNFDKSTCTNRKMQESITTLNRSKNINIEQKSINFYNSKNNKNNNLSSKNSARKMKGYNFFIDYLKNAKFTKAPKNIQFKYNFNNKLIKTGNCASYKKFSHGINTPFNSSYSIRKHNNRFKLSKKELEHINSIINKKHKQTKSNSLNKKTKNCSILEYKKNLLKNSNKNIYYYSSTNNDKILNNISFYNIDLKQNNSIEKSPLDKNFNKKNVHHKNILENRSINFTNDIIKQKMQKILSESEREILQIRKDFANFITSTNSPNSKKAINKFENTSSAKKIRKKIYVNTKKNKINLITKKNKTKKEKKNSNISQNSENINNEEVILNGTLIHDSTYYLNESLKLTNYIREYYNKNKTYPETNLNFYKYGRIIGQGAFGKVNLGLNILTGRVVAIKSFNKMKLDVNGENMKKINYETNLMRKLSHPNVTKILEMFDDEDYFLIVMEYINGGNLFSFVKKRRKLSEKKAKFLFKQIILGIQYIHSKNIIHRDIKLENILIDLNNKIKICDFGIGIILEDSHQKIYDKCGTPMYMAPEILLSSKKNKRGYEGPPVDIWSCGIALYIMLSGKLPFSLKETTNNEEDMENNLELQYDIINNEPKKIDGISELAKDLLKKILNKNPNERLTCDKILEHPWLNDSKIFDNNKKFHLFTQTEMNMLSKTFIDYRNSKFEDLIENFSISNLKRDDNINNKNITEKSTILAPYNSIIEKYDNYYEDNETYEDINNNRIKLENNILIFGEKPKEFNLFYELNNNGEVDNGILINSNTNTTSSIESTKNNKNDYKKYMQKNEDSNSNSYKVLKCIRKNNNEKGIDYKILLKIEKMGYDKDYVINCLKRKKLCHATSLYFLLENYDNI